MGITDNFDPETWVDRYGDYLYGYALSRIQDSPIAEDLVQETFLSALQSLKQFEGRSSLKTWLTGILKHKIMDHFRKKIREGTAERSSSIENLDEFFDEMGQWRQAPAKWTANPHNIYEQHEFMKVLQNCLSELPGRLSIIFTLREMMDESTQKICQILDISATNCGVMLYRARMYLRRCLEINWISGKTFEDFR